MEVLGHVRAPTGVVVVADFSLVAPWSAPGNDEYVDAVFRGVQARAVSQAWGHSLHLDYWFDIPREMYEQAAAAFEAFAAGSEVALDPDQALNWQFGVWIPEKPGIWEVTTHS